MAAITGNGTVFSWDGTPVGQVQSLSGPSMSVATIDVTDIAGTSKVFIAGMVDGGEVTIEVSYDGATQVPLTSALTSGTGQTWEIEFTDGSTVSGNGLITSFSPSASIDDKITASFTLKVTGDVAFGAPSA